MGGNGLVRPTGVHVNQGTPDENFVGAWRYDSLHYNGRCTVSVPVLFPGKF